MKSKILMLKSVIICTVLFLYPATELFSQVGVGTEETPVEGSLLQLKEINGVTDDALNAYKGLAMPRVSLTAENDLYPMFLNDPTYSGAMKSVLDKTHTGLVVYNVNTTPPFEKGLYIWDGSGWKAVGGGGSVTASNGLTKTGDDIGLGGALSAATTVTLGGNDLQFDATGAGKMSIGGNPTASSAILEVAATDKGVLLPKVTLTGTKDVTTIANPATGLLVYNTGNNPAYTRQGYMFWNGTEWRTIDNDPAIAPSIATLECGSASLSPGEYQVNVPYNGTMKIPYTGGNGAKYSSGLAVVVNGLTFQLQDGKLENGNGDLIFKVSGTPTKTSPDATSVTINKDRVPFYTGSCTVKVGDQISSEIRTMAVLGPLKYTTEGANGYATAITTPDGYFSVRVFVASGVNTANANLQIRNNRTGQVTIIWNHAYAWNGGSGGHSNNSLKLSPNTWSGNNGDAGDNTTTGKDAAWGNEWVYAGSRPEQRSYMWTTTDVNDKTAYILTFMMGATSTGNADATRAAATSAFFKIDQIYAR